MKGIDVPSLLATNLQDLTPSDGQWAVWGTGVLAVLSFALVASEKLQRLLGPFGRWLENRKHNRVRNQIDLEELQARRHEAQLRVLLLEVEFYRSRYEALLEEMEGRDGGDE